MTESLRQLTDSVQLMNVEPSQATVEHLTKPLVIHDEENDAYTVHDVWCADFRKIGMRIFCRLIERSSPCKVTFNR